MFLKHGTGRHRSLGGVDQVRVGILQEADTILIEEIRENEISQVLCVLLPVKSAGVMGDFGPTGTCSRYGRRPARLPVWGLPWERRAPARHPRH